MRAPKTVLVIDSGGTNVKVLTRRQDESRKSASGPRLTPGKTVAGVKALTKDWQYYAVPIGYPGVIRNVRMWNSASSLTGSRLSKTTSAPGEGGSFGRSPWRKLVAEVAGGFMAAFLVDDISLGGGNVRKLDRLPNGCRAGANAHALPGGFRLWKLTERWPCHAHC
jgi:hypothetical protein